jgi:leader peptidase (prepilin peptidase)/N-methyltransferase
MLGYLLAALAGLVLGGLVNLLANWLPQFSRTDRERHAEEQDTTDEVTETGAVSPRPTLFRYVAVEIVMVAAGLYLWQREGLTPMFGILLFYIALFLLVAVIDIEHLLVLDVVMIPAFIFALLEIVVSRRVELRDALAGYAVGQIILMGFYLLARVYLWIVNASRETPVTAVPFGFGDVTLVTFCGLVVGIPDVIFLVVLMILFGGIIAFLYLIVRSVILRSYKAHTAIPYGPSIILAAVVMLLWGDVAIRLMLGGR